MNDKYAAAFDDIVFLITRLLFGDAQAANPVFQQCVKFALLSMGVWSILEGLKE